MSQESIENVENLSFEAALAELQDIVRNIEAGKDDLDKIITNFERGNALKKHCEKQLKEAKLKVDKIITNSDSEAASTEPYIANPI